MTCPRVRERLQALVDGVLPEAAAQAVEAHLVLCPVCRGEVEALRALDQSLAGEELVAPPPELAANIVRQLAAQHAARQLRTTPVWMEAVTLAGAMAAAGGIAFVGLQAIAHATGAALSAPLVVGCLVVAAALGLAGAGARYYQA